MLIIQYVVERVIIVLCVSKHKIMEDVFYILIDKSPTARVIVNSSGISDVVLSSPLVWYHVHRDTCACVRVCVCVRCY